MGRHDLPIVETDNGDLVWDEPAKVPEAVSHAAGDLIVTTEDPVKVGAVALEDGCRLPTPRLAPITVKYAWWRQVEPGLVEGLGRRACSSQNGTAAAR